MLPTSGLTDQVTPVLLLPETVAVNCAVWLAETVALAGVILIATGGFSVTVALADFVESAADVAVTTICCCAVIVAGAL